jgi:hypothetical protein
LSAALAGDAVLANSAGAAIDPLPRAWVHHLTAIHLLALALGRRRLRNADVLFADFLIAARAALKDSAASIRNLSALRTLLLARRLDARDTRVRNGIARLFIGADTAVERAAATIGERTAIVRATLGRNARNACIGFAIANLSIGTRATGDGAAARIGNDAALHASLLTQCLFGDACVRLLVTNRSGSTKATLVKTTATVGDGSTCRVLLGAARGRAR